MQKNLKSLAGKLAGTAIIASLVIIILWLFNEEPATQVSQDTDSPGVSVTVIDARPDNARLSIETTGITRARWMTDIRASVTGRVQELSPQVLPGNLVSRNQVLATLQATHYESEVKAAEASVAAARLELESIRKHQQIATEVDKAPSAYGRREPHVRAAEAQLDSAKATLAAAQKQLDDTRIRAPFDAVIIADSLAPGMWVNNGELLLTVAASDYLDVKVEVSGSKWLRIKDAIRSGSDMHVIAPDGKQWPATLRFVSPMLDPVTRQHSITLQIRNPYQGDAPLLPEQQVQVVFREEPLGNVVKAPASVLTRDGKVWSVTNDTLKLEEIELLDEKPDFVQFRYLHNEPQQRLLVRYPLSTMLPGQQVAHVKR